MSQARTSDFIPLNLSEEQNQNLQLFLKKEEIIRILITEGAGSGDFMASVFILKRLRELGFNGKIELIHDIDLNQESNLQKIFGLPIDISDDYEDSELKVRFINLARFIELRKNNLVVESSLGMTGAFLVNPCSDLPDHQSHIINQLEDPLCLNPANFLNVKTYVNLSNWPTPTKNPEFYESRIYLKNTDTVYSLDESTTYFGSHENTIDVKQYLHEHKNNILDYHLLDHLTDLILYKDKINFMPVYGKNLREYFTNNEHEYNMLQVISGIAYAKRSKKTVLSDKPTVIGIFYHYKNEGEKLAQLIKHSDEQIPNIRETIENLNLKQNFIYANLNDADLITILETLRPEDILLLGMGPQQEPVFNWFFTYNHRNVLTPIREGSSSCATLLRKGEPHFRCGGNNVGNAGGKWELELDINSVKDEMLLSQLQNIYSPQAGFCDGQWTWRDNHLLYQDLGDLMIQAVTPGSSFVNYFHILKEEASKIENDRIATSIAKAIELADIRPKNTFPLIESKVTSIFSMNRDTNLAVTIYHDQPEFANPLFDSGKWDNAPTSYDWYTKKPIFTYRLYNQNEEVGSMQFYGAPLLCVTEGKQHNIISTTGILNAFTITDDMPIETVCQLLPPTLFDKVVIASGRSALQGCLSGCAEVLGVTLKTRGMAPKWANFISQFALYGSLFMIKYDQYNRMLDTWNADTDRLQALYLAGLETGQLLFINMALEITNHLLQNVSKYFTSPASNVIQFCGKLSLFGAFAYHGYDNMATTGTSLLSGVLAKEITKIAGYYFFPLKENDRNNHSSQVSTLKKKA